MTANSPILKSDDFSVGITVQQKIGSGEEFLIKAQIKNKTANKLTITRGEKSFRYMILDSSGKRINSLMRKSIGINHQFPSKEYIVEEYRYKINRPGTYYISAIAEFTVNDGVSKNYGIETDQKAIEIIDKIAD